MHASCRSPERTSDWVLEASTLHSSPDQPVGGEASSMKPPASTSSSSRAAAALHEGDHGAVYMSIKLKSNTSKSEDDDSNTLKGAAAPYRGNNSVHADEPGNTPRWPRRSSEGFDEAGASYRPQRAIQSMDSADEGLEEVGYQGYEASIPAPRAGTAGWAGAEAASDPSAGGGGGSDVGSEAAGGSVSSATDADNSEDLAVDARWVLSDECADTADTRNLSFLTWTVAFCHVLAQCTCGVHLHLTGILLF